MAGGPGRSFTRTYHVCGEPTSVQSKFTGVGSQESGSAVFWVSSKSQKVLFFTKPFAFITALVKFTLPVASNVSVIVTAPEGMEMKFEHSVCACRDCISSKHIDVIITSANRRGVVEKFMVKKFDDGKRKEVIVKECGVLFINQVGLE